MGGEGSISQTPIGVTPVNISAFYHNLDQSEIRLPGL
jgi:hypothetical protein